MRLSLSFNSFSESNEANSRSHRFLDFPLTMQGFAAPTQIAIQLNEASDSKLRGIDAYLCSWE